MPIRNKEETPQNEDLSIFFHRWTQRFGIMDRWGMTNSEFYATESQRCQPDVIVCNSGFSNNHNFNDCDW